MTDSPRVSVPLRHPTGPGRRLRCWWTSRHALVDPMFLERLSVTPTVVVGVRACACGRVTKVTVGVDPGPQPERAT